MRLKASTHPSALPSDELVILSLDAGSAAGVVVLLLKVRVILEFLRCLGKTNRHLIKSILSSNHDFKINSWDLFNI